MLTSYATQLGALACQLGVGLTARSAGRFTASQALPVAARDDSDMPELEDIACAAPAPVPSTQLGCGTGAEIKACAACNGLGKVFTLRLRQHPANHRRRTSHHSAAAWQRPVLYGVCRAGVRSHQHDGRTHGGCTCHTHDGKMLRGLRRRVHRR